MDTNPSPAPPRKARTAGVLAAAVAAVVVGAVVYATTRGSKEDAVAAAQCAASKALIATVDPLVHGEIAALQLARTPHRLPELSFQNGDGRTLHLADFAGRTVLLNLWATWCIPCRQEMPALDKLQAQSGGDRFEVVAVNLDQARLERRQAFLKDNAIDTLRFYADPSFDVFQTLKRTNGVVGLPTTFLIGPDGCAIGSMAGPAEWASPDAAALIKAVKDASDKPA